jgi:ATP-dependent RNA helicase DeaD
VNVRIESQALTVPAIEQVYYEVDRRSKLEVLCRLIDIEDIKFAIIFCATKMMVDELTEHLMARGYLADKLHGDISQQARERVMAKFRKHGFEFLVATDVAARGLDVDDIEVVFNYDLPHDGEDYVHRIGRTGRAGRKGRAITFVAGREIYKMQNIARFTKGQIKRARVPSAEQVEEKRTNLFLESLKETLEGGEYKRHDELIERLLDQGHTATDIASALINLLNADKTRTGEKIAEDQPRREETRHRDFDGRTEDHHREPAQEHTGERRRRQEVMAEKPDLVSHEPGMVRLVMNVGRTHNIGPGDVVGVILGAVKIPKECVGAILLLPKQTLVDVSEQHLKLILKKLNGIRFKGHKLTVGVAK